MTFLMDTQASLNRTSTLQVQKNKHAGTDKWTNAANVANLPTYTRVFVDLDSSTVVNFEANHTIDDTNDRIPKRV